MDVKQHLEKKTCTLREPNIVCGRQTTFGKENMYIAGAQERPCEQRPSAELGSHGVSWTIFASDLFSPQLFKEQVAEYTYKFLT